MGVWGDYGWEDLVIGEIDTGLAVGRPTVSPGVILFHGELTEIYSNQPVNNKEVLFFLKNDVTNIENFDYLYTGEWNYAVTGWTNADGIVDVHYMHNLASGEYAALGIFFGDTTYTASVGMYNNPFTVEEVSATLGDITKVTLDGKLLPESGTLNWILYDDAHVKVFFKNIGNLAGPTHIWLTDETGATLTGCDITTGDLAPGIDYYVDLCIYVPDVVVLKTLTAHIDP